MTVNKTNTKLVYVGFAFEHHLGTHGGYHHIAEYGGYDKQIDCQKYMESWWHPSNKICVKLWRRLMMRLFGFPFFPAYVLTMILLSLRQRCVFHIIYGENLYTQWMKKLTRHSKIVCTFHQPYNWFDNKKWLKNLKSIDNVILVGEKEINLFRQATGKDNVVFIPHGVYTDFYHPVESVPKENLLLTVGNWLRDYELAGKVYSKFLSKHKDWHVAVVANPTNTKLIHKKDGIKCLNGISDEELRDLYLKSSVLFLPLKRYTANNSLLEAAACGCNILIASDNADNSYIPSEFIDIVNMDAKTILTILEKRFCPPPHHQYRTGKLCNQPLLLESDRKKSPRLSPKNILFIENYLKPSNGGVERVTFLISKELEKRGYKCYIAFTDIDDECVDNERKLKYSHAMSFDELDRLFSSFVIEKRISIIVNQHNYGDKIYQVLKHLKQNVGIRILTFDHGSPNAYIMHIPDYYSLSKRCQRIKERIKYLGNTYAEHSRNKMYELSEYMILLSPGFIDDFSRLFKIKDRSKLLSIPNPLTFEENYNDEFKKKQVLMVTRFINIEKNITGALRIWSRIEKAGVNGWTFVIAGDGMDDRMIRGYARSLKLQKVIFTGRVDNPQQLYRESQIFMMTSHMEGFGLTLTESLQNAVIPIAFDTFATVHDIIKDGFNGFIIPNGDEEAYANRMMEVMNDDVLRLELKNNAYKSADKFNIHTIGNKWEEVLRSV